MIISSNLANVPPIMLSVYLIIHLFIVELSNEKLKKALLPITLVLLAVFGVIVIQSIFF